MHRPKFMHIIRLAFSAGALLLGAWAYPQQATAEEFTGRQFLSWQRENQNAFITYSITMTAIIATQGRKDISRCIDEWYPLDPEVKAARQELILKTIAEYPNYHPQAVILAVLQKQCGSFKEAPPASVE